VEPDRPADEDSDREPDREPEPEVDDLPLFQNKSKND
jgi:hypothetical protein